MTEFKVGDEVFVNTPNPYHTQYTLSMIAEGRRGVTAHLTAYDGCVDDDGDVWVEFADDVYPNCAWIDPKCLSLVNPPQENNPVSPSHYAEGMPEGIQVIDIIKAQSADYLHGNVIKYVLRWKFKNGVEDLKKARVYIDWLIEQEESRT